MLLLKYVKLKDTYELEDTNVLSLSYFSIRIMNHVYIYYKQFFTNILFSFFSLQTKH